MAVGLLVVDPLDVEQDVERIPSQRFVRVKRAVETNPALDDGHRQMLLRHHEWQRAAVALPHDDDHPALAVLVLRQPAVLAVLYTDP